MDKIFVVGASRSLISISERDARTTLTPHNLCGGVLVQVGLNSDLKPDAKNPSINKGTTNAVPLIY